MAYLISIAAKTPFDKKRISDEVEKSFSNTVFFREYFFEFIKKEAADILAISHLATYYLGYKKYIDLYQNFITYLRKEYYHIKGIVLVDINPIDISLLFRKYKNCESHRPSPLELNPVFFDLDTVFLTHIRKKHYDFFSDLVLRSEINDTIFKTFKINGGVYDRFKFLSEQFGFNISYYRGYDHQSISKEIVNELLMALGDDE